MNRYEFCSKRLGFRNWQERDITPLFEINNDPLIMEFFPSLPTLKETTDFVRRMQDIHKAYGYCYFAVDHLDSGRFIGFIGLCNQEYQSPFTPCVDIGWRLHKDFWGMGLATEGAQKCLDHAFKSIGLDQVRSIAPKINLRSIRVMQKIGMQFLGNFKHPKLKTSPLLVTCVCYETTQSAYLEE